MRHVRACLLQPCGVASSCNPAYVQPPTFGVFTWELLCPLSLSCPPPCACWDAGCGRDCGWNPPLRYGRNQPPHSPVRKTPGSAARGPMSLPLCVTPAHTHRRHLDRFAVVGRSMFVRNQLPPTRLTGRRPPTVARRAGRFCPPPARVEAVTPFLPPFRQSRAHAARQECCTTGPTKAQGSWSSRGAWPTCAQSWSALPHWRRCKRAR